MRTTVPKYIPVLLKILFVLLLAAVGAFMFQLHRYDYNGFVDYLLDEYGVPGKKADFTTMYLTESRFNFLKAMITIVFIGLFLFFLRIWRATEVVAATFYGFITQFWDKWQQFLSAFFELKKSQKGLLLFTFLFLVSYRLYYYFETPLLVDEVFSYLHFVSKGFLVSSVFYPGPNNHVFYNQMCSVIGYFSDDPVLVMRLPVMVFGLITSIVLFIIVKKHFDFTIAFGAYLLYSFSPNVTLYSVIGRGYIFSVLFMLVFFISVVNIIREKDRKYYNIAFVLSATLGFYTLPSFFYPFCSIVFFSVFFGLLRRGIDISWIIYNTLIVFLIINLLYLPVYIFNGVDAVFDNTWIRSLTLPWPEYFKALPGYFSQVNNWLWCVESGGIYISIGVFAMSIYTLFNDVKLSRHFWLYMIISLSLIPLAIITIQHVLPYERVWLYFTFFQYLYLAIAIYGVAKLFKNKAFQIATVGILSLAVMIWQSLLLKADYTLSIQASKKAAKMSKSLIEKPLRSIALYPSEVTDVYYNYLKLQCKLSEKQIDLIYRYDGEGDVVIYPKGMVKRKKDTILTNDEYVEVLFK